MTTLLLLNGGVGTRAKAGMPKQLVRVNGIPLFIYTLRVADELNEINKVVINSPKGWEEQIQTLISDYAIKTNIEFVDAGETRQESVYKMLSLVKSESVIIHESARPLVDKNDFKKLIASKSLNVSTVLNIPFTVLKKDCQSSLLTENLNRDELVNIQLPQKFDTNILKLVHNKYNASKQSFTEDASMLIAEGEVVDTLYGQDKNFKVTTPQDIHLAEYILSKINDESYSEQ
ncbi:2-C-methyl-D-erythritol 4-phosphate cytidylyltransferase [Shewanella electrodiphila]|uniref:2-C-methyl-D-erythritol 4-phosphate cytidylyltransferase n=1 Tax=Shewanella electrodiphila TaxID=934143 RepID=A0ABT0KJW0_9GAMM|nr:2-C-methyl-D-erythritol 4-phosphate cytidylyltransferase [Shewanella electrodiphila]MCL1044128.1 2-C-methyl-D-erythritol 4-phosphate cytidylyltransferase [Shewanella electrodiphila]